tara:strand:- start:671 stop:1033 length:363 start_codon:yes stop_codon:yes gene_type:complete
VHEGEDRARPAAIFVLSAIDIEGIDQEGNDGDQQVRHIDGYDFVSLTWAVIVGWVCQASDEAMATDQCFAKPRRRPCNLHGKPEYPDQRKLNEVQPVACIGRFVDEYIGWLEGVDDPEER